MLRFTYKNFNGVIMKNIAENITFEKAIEELEDIIKSLEQGDVPLDNTIELYERGAKLKDFCEKKLIDAEIKIKKINKYSNTKEISIED
tara:strand:+ start:36 stop:302 length:267 start_codon:yes stop_codon:yes gene_type:complete